MENGTKQEKYYIDNPNGHVCKLFITRVNHHFHWSSMIPYLSRHGYSRSQNGGFLWKKSVSSRIFFNFSSHFRKLVEIFPTPNHLFRSSLIINVYCRTSALMTSKLNLPIVLTITLHSNKVLLATSLREI
jgi:hypothetical protein